MSRSRTPRWLGLAVRARQWALDEHGYALQQARAAEAAAQRRHDGASEAMDAAHVQRRELISRSFGADELLRHADHELKLRGESANAQQQLRSAVELSDGIRAQMQQTLAQRDAYRGRLQRLEGERVRDAARAGARELDELWLLRTRDED